MSDPMTSLRDRTGVLGVALAQWADGDAAQDKAAARRAASAAVDAIDALLRDPHTPSAGAGSQTQRRRGQSARYAAATSPAVRPPAAHRPRPGDARHEWPTWDPSQPWDSGR